MNKSDFESELKELMSTMSEEEIEKAISALSECKVSVYQKSNQEKADMSRLLSTTEYHEAELHYIGKGRKEGTMKTVGASLLTSHDECLMNKIIPKINDTWWLYDGFPVTANGVLWNHFTNDTGKIRPVLIIDEISGDLNAGEIFCINGEDFKLLTPMIAIRISCIKDACTFNATNYDSSVLRYCVDGWYMKLIHENDLLKKVRPGET